jgi:N-acetylglutamate synthase-like GNAT family acetyltransferase
MNCDFTHGHIQKNNTLMQLTIINKEHEVIASADISTLKTDKPFIWLHHIEVEPECRKHGLASDIIEKIVKVGKKEGAELIYAYPAQPMDTEVTIPETQIKVFYEKLGFKACDAPKDAVTITDEGLKKSGLCLKLK